MLSDVLFNLQESTRDTTKLLPDEREAVVEEVARKLGLKRVGWIFTDLIADDIQRGTVCTYIRESIATLLSTLIRGGVPSKLSREDCLLLTVRR